MYFFPQFSKKLKQKRERVFLNTLTGKQSQISYIRMEPGETVCHSHKEEQMGYIIEGSAEITIDKESRICKIGDAYFIPSDTMHSFKTLNIRPVEYIEVFCPPKEENILD